MIEIVWGGETLQLLAERALYWPRLRWLLIADPHFGKAAAFRNAGIPIPSGTTQDNLERLAQLIHTTGSERLIVLGDFFHARSGRQPRTLQAIAAWRSEHAQLDVLLVRGNHDRASGDPPAEWNFACATGPLSADALWLDHQPNAHPKGPVLAGHLHPAYRLYDVAGPSVRAACFWVGPRVAVLPAFGTFTGMHTICPTMGDRVFVVGPNAVVEIPVQAWSGISQRRGTIPRTPRTLNRRCRRDKHAVGHRFRWPAGGREDLVGIRTRSQPAVMQQITASHQRQNIPDYARQSCFGNDR